MRLLCSSASYVCMLSYSTRRMQWAVGELMLSPTAPPASCLHLICATYCMHVLLLCAVPQASTPCTPVSPLRGDAACHIAAEVVVPAGGGTAEQPMLLSVSVHNPRLVLVRRFVNNVVYVMGLVNHEVVAAGSSRRAAAPAGRASAAAGRDAPPAASSAVVLVSITNAQVRHPQDLGWRVVLHQLCPQLCRKTAAAGATARPAHCIAGVQLPPQQLPTVCTAVVQHVLLIPAAYVVLCSCCR